MNIKELSEFAKKHEPLISKICDLMTAANVSPEDGENALIWCVGLSMGLRNASLTEGPIMELLAQSWQIAVHIGYDPSKWPDAL